MEIIYNNRNKFQCSCCINKIQTSRIIIPLHAAPNTNTAAALHASRLCQAAPEGNSELTEVPIDNNNDTQQKQQQQEQRDDGSFTQPGRTRIVGFVFSKRAGIIAAEMARMALLCAVGALVSVVSSSSSWPRKDGASGCCDDRTWERGCRVVTVEAKDGLTRHDDNNLPYSRDV